MKRLFFANPQHFISWLMPGAILLGERNVVLKSRTLETDTLYNVRISYLLASLVFEKPGEREWLDWRFAMFQDILRESYVYQTILREGLEEGLEQGREQTLRQTLRTYVQTRFPQLALLTEQQTSPIKDATVLHTVLAKLFTVQTPEEAEQYLLTLGDDSKKN